MAGSKETVYIKADRIQMKDDLRGRSEFMISLMITA